jgi:hypothetical protein
MLTIIGIAAVIVIVALLSERAANSNSNSYEGGATSPLFRDDRFTPTSPLTEYRYVEGRGGQVERPTGYGSYQGVTRGESYKGYTYGSLRK